MEYKAGAYDIAVVGAGHAGTEAAFTAAKLGAETILFTISLDSVANLPCNPSIGGTAKGHLVREIDALGGEMGLAADATFLQSRMLNRGKGPAVHSLRVQTDRQAYHRYMKHRLELTPYLDLKQAEITGVRRGKKGQWEVVTALGAVYAAKCVILATGTYLGGKIYVGESAYTGGPDASKASLELTGSLRSLGIPLRRFKTGTPARALRSSIDFTVLEEQPGDSRIVPFSFMTDPGALPQNQVTCHIAYTNEQTHQVIRDSLHRSPLYSGRIEGVGPRYCPSIEDKVVRFGDKPRHQIFVEPMGLDTEEMYLQGMSSSLPEEVQEAFYHTIRGFEHIRITRNAYAIEYDCCDPMDLTPALSFKKFPGLFGAGQFNGTSGYEEAAAQGLVAGVNAVRWIRGQEPLVLGRHESYIGTLIDDLVTKGCSDPYRMMTSRSEYRLLLRQDNADLRLTPIGRDIGLVDDLRWEQFCCKRELVNGQIKKMEKLVIVPTEELNRLLVSRGTAPIENGMKAADLLRRPQVHYDDIKPYDPAAGDTREDVAEEAEINIKYEGYIRKQVAEVERVRKLEQKMLPEDIQYGNVTGLRLEAAEKLERVRPRSIGQASRISGVNPADISVLLIYLHGLSGKNGQKEGEEA